MKKSDYLKIGLFWTIIVTMSFVTLQNVVDKHKLEIKNSEMSQQINELNIKLNEANTDKKPRTIGVSVAGMQHIKQYESLSLKPYRIKGEKLMTIGYGHQIRKNDPQWLKNKANGGSISTLQAEYILYKDIQSFVNPAINRLYAELERHGVDTSKFSQGFTDGIGSLIFNCGEAGVRNTEFFRTLKRGHINKAIALVPKTRVYMKGHAVRRIAEAKMMEYES